MTPEDWFGVFVRVFAIPGFTLSVQNILYFIDVRSGLSAGSSFTDGDPQGYLLYALGYFVFAMILLRSAPTIVDFTYPKPPRTDHLDQDDKTPSPEPDEP